MTEPLVLSFDNDKLDLKPFSEKLERFLMVDHDFVEGSLVVSLNAQFGSGKSTFLSMWKADLEERKNGTPSTPTPIILNAWESDFCGDPLLSIITALIKAAEKSEVQASPEAGSRLREAAKDVAWFVTGLANNLASHWTGFDPITAGEFAKAKKDGRTPERPDFVRLYEQRNQALENLKKSLREIFGGDSPKAIIFVDELDRCRPDYAISYLETIKHVFDVHGLVFVLAVDYEQLSCSAKALFGEMNFPDYFRKFVHRTLTLPSPAEASLRKLTQHFASTYIESEGRRTSLFNLNQQSDSIIELITALKMPPRQIQEMFRVIGHITAGEQSKRGKMFPCLGAGVVLMAALKAADPQRYRLIGMSQQNHKAMGEFFVKLLRLEKAEWWFTVYVTGTGAPIDSEGFGMEAIFKDLGFLTKDATLDKEMFRAFRREWGGGGTARLVDIHNKIESALVFQS